MLKGHNLTGFTEPAAGDHVVRPSVLLNEIISPGKFTLATDMEAKEAVAKTVTVFGL